MLRGCLRSAARRHQRSGEHGTARWADESASSKASRREPFGHLVMDFGTRRGGNMRRKGMASSAYRMTRPSKSGSHINLCLRLRVGGAAASSSRRAVATHEAQARLSRLVAHTVRPEDWVGCIGSYKGLQFRHPPKVNKTIIVQYHRRPFGKRFL